MLEQNENLFDKWYTFRDEELSYIQEEYLKAGCDELESLCQDMLEYTDKWNKKYYKAGWNDSLEMIFNNKFFKSITK